MSDQETTQHSTEDDHKHRYELKGDGGSRWAECACGEKLAGQDGTLIGARAVEAVRGLGHGSPA